MFDEIVRNEAKPFDKKILTDFLKSRIVHTIPGPPKRMFMISAPYSESKYNDIRLTPAGHQEKRDSIVVQGFKFFYSKTPEDKEPRLPPLDIMLPNPIGFYFKNDELKILIFDKSKISLLFEYMMPESGFMKLDPFDNVSKDEVKKVEAKDFDLSNPFYRCLFQLGPVPTAEEFFAFCKKQEELELNNLNAIKEESFQPPKPRKVSLNEGYPSIQPPKPLKEEHPIPSTQPPEPIKATTLLSSVKKPNILALIFSWLLNAKNYIVGLIKRIGFFGGQSDKVAKKVDSSTTPRLN